MIKQLLDFLSNILVITGNNILDNILFLVIGVLSFSIAFGLVGEIFDSIGIYDSDLMSDTHWLIRLIVFVVLYFVFRFIAKLIIWLFSFKWWVYLIALIVIIVIIALTHFLRHKYMDKKSNTSKVIIDNTDTEPKKEDDAIIDKRAICPRCGGKLVKRHGPYGNFYGCENYSKTECRYTRKHF